MRKRETFSVQQFGYKHLIVDRGESFGVQPVLVKMSFQLYSACHPICTKDVASNDDKNNFNQIAQLAFIG